MGWGEEEQFVFMEFKGPEIVLQAFRSNKSLLLIVEIVLQRSLYFRNFMFKKMGKIAAGLKTRRFEMYWKCIFI